VVLYGCVRLDAKVGVIGSVLWASLPCVHCYFGGRCCFRAAVMQECFMCRCVACVFLWCGYVVVFCFGVTTFGTVLIVMFVRFCFCSDFATVCL